MDLDHVEEFIGSHNGETRDILWEVHRLILAFPDIRPRIRYRIPFYDHTKWVCYLNPLKKGPHLVELCFIRGAEWTHLFPILHLQGRKQIAGIRFSTLADVDPEKILPILEHALEQNDLNDSNTRRSI
ncbi:MAG: DUF1801 domain-containing protein [Bacteroidota bacterium]|nr:DUF1801 domain-containing protein [Bacteroidota bacterium]